VATYNKDFKVKNGLNVALGGSFGGAVEVGEPTDSYHATTKSYVDNRFNTLQLFVETNSTAPVSPLDGQLWFDTDTLHLSIYSETLGDWIILATLDDSKNLPQHIHDTAIDGSGLITVIFSDAGFYDSIYTSEEIAGFYDSETWTNSYDGGNPLNNYN
jgi:hypothetical protein